jgi:hypothetical protein
VIPTNEKPDSNENKDESILVAVIIFIFSDRKNCVDREAERLRFHTAESPRERGYGKVNSLFQQHMTLGSAIFYPST